MGTAGPWLSLGKEGSGGMLETAALISVPQPEGEEDEPTLEELEHREVLVLGLDGSGKSTFLRMLSGKPPLEGHVPTWGFNSVRLPTKNFKVDLLESEQGTPSPHHHCWPGLDSLEESVKCISKQDIYFPFMKSFLFFSRAQDTEHSGI